MSLTASGLLALGWDGGWAEALEKLGVAALQPGRVSRVDRGLCTVMTGASEIRLVPERGVDVAVGDWVAFDPAGGPKPRVESVLPRRSSFRRTAEAEGSPPHVVAANIDTVFVCDALDGSLGLRHLERFLALAWQSGATPVVLITKSDTAAPAVVVRALEAVKSVSASVDVVVVSSTTGEGVSGVAPYLVPGRTAALLGLSGAGKSTLLNLLVGADVLSTGAVRRDGSGRHTTTHREMVLLPGGGLLIDTPGMRALSVVGATEGVEQAFEDLEALSRNCRYRNCRHSGESECAVAAAIADGRIDPKRVESWVRLRSEPATSQIADQRSDVAERKRRKAAKVADRRAPKA